VASQVWLYRPFAVAYPPTANPQPIPCLSAPGRGALLKGKSG